MCNGYFSLPRSLTRDPLWINSPPAYRDVFITILDHICFKAQKFDDHGVIIDLLPGQVCASIREIKQWCGRFGNKNIVERSLEKFSSFNLLRLEVRHKKTVITITHKDTYELILMGNETTSETILRQSRDNLETQKKNVKNEKNKEIYKEKILSIDSNINDHTPNSSSVGIAVNQDFANLQHNIHYQSQEAENEHVMKNESNNLYTSQKKVKRSNKPPQPEKIKFREWVELTQKEYDTLIETHGIDLTNRMLDLVDGHNTKRQEHYLSDYGVLKKNSWPHREALKQIHEDKLRSGPIQPNKTNKNENIDVEVIEARKAFANKIIAEKWPQFRIEMRPRTMPEYIISGNDKIYYKDQHFDKLFENLLRKAI